MLDSLGNLAISLRATLFSGLFVGTSLEPRVLLGLPEGVTIAALCCFLLLWSSFWDGKILAKSKTNDPVCPYSLNIGIPRSGGIISSVSDTKVCSHALGQSACLPAVQGQIQGTAFWPFPSLQARSSTSWAGGGWGPQGPRGAVA